MREQQLARVVKSSDVGHTIFSFAVEQLQRSMIRKLIDTIIEQQADTNITEAIVQQDRDEFIQSLLVKGQFAHCVGASYAIEVSYCGVLVPLQVHSPVDEFLAHKAAFTHTVGVETNVLPRLFCEAELVAQGRARPAIAVEEACVADSKRARLAASSLIKQAQAENGADLVPTMRE